MKKFIDESAEMNSLMKWLERRVEWGTITAPLHIATFKEMWKEIFGSLDNIPPDFKQRITERIRELKSAGR